MQHNLIIGISEVHVVKYDVTFQLHICGWIAICMLVCPRPESGTLLTWHKLSIFALCIDQLDIALVHFRLLVQQIEDSLRSGKCHYDCIDLHTDLVDWHVEVLVERQEARQTAQRESADISNRQYTTDDRTEHVADISKLRVDRS